jgi:hypothetical protein
VNTTTQRIITAATKAIVAGADPIDAIEDACANVATTPVARERARNMAVAFFARIERQAVAS